MTTAHVNSKEFDQLVALVMDEFKVPGLSIAVVHGDDVWSKAYGFADTSLKKPATSETIFDCASTSKSFTAACVALLVQDNENFPDVQWDTPVSKLLPDDFVLPDPLYTEQVTIEDILSHRTGMPTHDESYLGIFAANPDTPKSLTRNLRNLPLNKALRTTFQYNNMMYTAASYLVETLAKKPYGEFLREKFWDPLGMSNTYHDFSSVQARGAQAKLADACVWDKKKGAYFAKEVVSEPEGQGAGSIFSCASDYIKWVQSFLKKTGPLSEDSQKELAKGRSISHWSAEDKIPFYGQSVYGLGLYAESYRGHEVVGHDGGVTGFESLMRFLPEHGWGIYVIGNANGANDVGAILFHWLVDRLLGVREEERVDWVKWYKEQNDKYEAQEGKVEDWEKELRKEEKKELGVPLEQVAGHYYHPGYKDFVVTWKDGKLVADCSDRCFGLKMEFEHISGDTFVALVTNLHSRAVFRDKSAVRIEDGVVKAVGYDFEPKLEGKLIWFERVD